MNFWLPTVPFEVNCKAISSTVIMAIAVAITHMVEKGSGGLVSVKNKRCCFGGSSVASLVPCINDCVMKTCRKRS